MHAFTLRASGGGFQWHSSHLSRTRCPEALWARHPGRSGTQVRILSVPYHVAVDTRPPGPSPYPEPPAYGPPATPPPGPAAYAGPATYRPMRQAKTVWLAGGVGVVAFALVFIATRGGPGELLLMMAVVAGIVGVVLGAYFLYLQSLSLTVDAGGVTRRALGRVRRIPRDRFQRVVLASYLQRSRYASQEVHLVALVDAAGRSLLTLNLLTWAGSDAQAIVSQLGLTGRETSLGLRPARQLKKEVPGALPWVVAHRVATLLIVIGITLVVVAAIATGAVLTGS